MWAYAKARLGEHSTQVGLGAVLAALGAALQGQLSWQNAITAIGGALVPILMPSGGAKA